ncbi:sugar kinase [Candidatus Woesearchaeota archaeon]|nr:sugar kinase [Candidatus Woesearchaeota archaeon]
MVDVVVVGSIGLDTIETPFGKVQDALGGAAVYASYAASFFCKPGIVSIAGKDFPKTHIALLEKQGIDLSGLNISGKTFRWQGLYEYDMNEAKTLKTELNALQEFNPTLPSSYKDASYLFLGNIDPILQLQALQQMKKPRLTVMDTMNFWIEHKREDLIKTIKQVNVFLCNDGEARELFQTTNLVTAATKALALGPKFVIIKKGEHGALLFTESTHFNCAGYPLENIKDPTGCGDTFGGGFIGYLAKTNDLSEKNIRKAMVYGSALASFTAEDFSLQALRRISMQDIEKRFHAFREMKEF